MRDKKKNIFLVEDHALLRQGLTQVINQQADLFVCGEADAAGPALSLIERKNPDLVTLDLTLKQSSGMELLKNIKTLFPKTPVLVLSMHEETLYAEQALRAGAMGYIMKEEAVEKVLVAIRHVLQGKIYMSEDLASKMLQQQLHGKEAESDSPLDRLSPRELEVLQMLGQWKSTSQIATELGLSIKTVQYYRDQLKAKLNLGSGTELVQYAVKWATNPQN